MLFHLFIRLTKNPPLFMSRAMGVMLVPFSKIAPAPPPEPRLVPLSLRSTRALPELVPNGKEYTPPTHRIKAAGGIELSTQPTTVPKSLIPAGETCTRP